MIEAGYLINTNEWQLSLSGHDLNLKSDELQKIKLFSNKYAPIKGEDLVRYVYKKFSYYAINSEIASRLLSKTELAEIEIVKPAEVDKKFFTIGYEGGSFEGYLNKVIKNKISTIIDVRKNPISRKYGFSKKTLSDTLQKFSIDYVHMPELGIESEKRQLLKSKSDFENLFNEYDNTVIASIKNKLNEINQFFNFSKTYPDASEKYFELACTAGFKEAGSWIRLYPIPFRLLDGEKQYKKYQWIEAKIEKTVKIIAPKALKF